MRFWDSFDHQENSNATIELVGDPQFEGLNYIIWDLSDIAELNMTREEIVVTATYDQLISSRLPQVKLALFAQDEQALNVCKQYIACYQTRQTGW